MGDTHRGVSVKPYKILYPIVTRVHSIYTVDSSYTAAAHSTTLAVQLGYSFGDSRKCDVPYVGEEKESVKK